MNGSVAMLRPANSSTVRCTPRPSIRAGSDAILGAIGPTETPDDFGLEPLLRVHSADYVEFLRTAHDQWRDAGRDGDAFPYTFPWSDGGRWR